MVGRQPLELLIKVRIFVPEPMEIGNNKPVIFELIRKCHYCRRAMDCAPREYAENPFCRCTKERLKIAASPEVPIWSAPDSAKMRVRGLNKLRACLDDANFIDKGTEDV